MQTVLTRQTLSEANPEITAKTGIGLKFLAVFFALRIVSGELHEQAHITVGRIVCGEYGVRDFSVWQTAENCAEPALAILASCAGPLFTYLLVWSGVYLLATAQTDRYRSLGFSIIFAPLPFARIFTALIGGGDEKVIFKYFLNDHISLFSVKVLAAVFVTAICLPPILYAGRKFNHRRRWLYITGFCVLPLIVLSGYQPIFNRLLENGFLADYSILGTQTLLLIHFAVMTMILIFFGKYLLTIKVLKNNAEFGK